MLMVLVTYDVSTTSLGGQKRLRRVAKKCVDYGSRVQNSVFECMVDTAQFTQLRHALEQIIDMEKDSIRYYFLGNNWRNRVEHVGVKTSFDPEGPMVV